MENKAHALAAGAFVLGLIAALVALVVWFTRDNTVRNVYELSTREAVSGLQPQAMVRYRGIAVGKVTSIDFDPKTKGNVRVRITVDERVPLTTSSYATLSYQGVTGLAFIGIDDKADGSASLVPDNDNPPRIPLKPSTLAQLQDRGEAILNQVEEVTKRANALLGDANQKRIADALENISQLATSANQVTRSFEATLKTRIDPALAAIPPLANTARESIGEFSRVAKSVNGTLTRLNAEGGTIDRLGTGTAALQQTLESLNNATLPRFNRAADDTSLAARRVGRMADTIADNPQSVLYGTGVPAPGPGEAGFVAPQARP
ncbi:MlaD family protein [Variovorax sp. PAMC 28711]|uniref:MlaD family protein n=1 Tax=Variovorax sp. PAMC 28711 TaxID=1795631 RepID=UPI00078B6CA6|nr:MlaD family protein [Variovorax sp. PAMC 28711]AMM24490.1 mammalian cell entry protein [Variovorax sp. PAMC 28711]